MTTGLLEKLDREELQGVIGHETLARPQLRHPVSPAGGHPRGQHRAARRHVRARVVLVGRSARRSRGKDSGGAGAIIMVVAIVFAILAPFFATPRPDGGQPPAGVPRGRLERRADPQSRRASSGRSSTISSDQEPLEVANRATQHLYIVNPIKKLDERSWGLFDPPAHRRAHRPAPRADGAAPARHGRRTGSRRPVLSLGRRRAIGHSRRTCG